MSRLMRRALARSRGARSPLSDGREFILDVAHNEEGARALDANLAALTKETGRNPGVITGGLGLARAKPLLTRRARARPRQPAARGDRAAREDDRARAARSGTRLLPGGTGSLRAGGFRGRN